VNMDMDTEMNIVIDMEMVSDTDTAYFQRFWVGYRIYR
jgi:hypothetical protein